MTKETLAALRHVFLVQQPAAIERDGRRLLIHTARQGLGELLAQQVGRAGVLPGLNVYANRPGNSNLETVVLPGPIVGLFDYRREAAIVGMKRLREASPEKTGDYRDSHMILLNGQQVDQLPVNLSRGDVITLTNPQPYARRLEIGRTKSGRKFTLKVPNRIYERAAKRFLSPIYRNLMSIRFDYIDLPDAYVTKAALPATYLTGSLRKRRSKFGDRGTPLFRKRRQKKGSTVRAPAIIIRALT